MFISLANTMMQILLRDLVLTLSSFGMFAMAAKAAEPEWWSERPVTLTVNGKAMGFSSLLGVQQVGDQICAINYMSFMGDETVHLFQGIRHDGRSELVKVRRIRGGMNESPQMELYAGVTGIVQRLYVGGDEEPRLFFLTPAAVPSQTRQSVELAAECAK